MASFSSIGLSCGLCVQLCGYYKGTLYVLHALVLSFETLQDTDLRKSCKTRCPTGALSSPSVVISPCPLLPLCACASLVTSFCEAAPLRSPHLSPSPRPAGVLWQCLPDIEEAFMEAEPCWAKLRLHPRLTLCTGKTQRPALVSFRYRNEISSPVGARVSVWGEERTTAAHRLWWRRRVSDFKSADNV